MQYDKLTVKFVRLVKRTDDYVVKELLLSNKSSTTPSERVIYHYQFITWSDHSVPEDVKSSLDFIKDFNDVYDRLNNAKPVTIHCRQATNYILGHGFDSSRKFLKFFLAFFLSTTL